MSEVTIWQDRFIKRELIPAGELAKRFNILNPRLHPEAQRDAVEESLETLGWIDEPSLSTNGPNYADLADNPDAVLKDGHLRIELALLRGGENALVPVNWYFLTEKETELALSTQDPTSEMAEYDTDKLAALLARTREMTADRPGLGVMLERLRLKAGMNGQAIDPMAEWQGMPEFEQEDKTAFQSIHVHFKNREDVNTFAELVGQKITDKTSYLWYPETQRQDIKNRLYQNEP